MYGILQLYSAKVMFCFKKEIYCWQKYDVEYFLHVWGRKVVRSALQQPSTFCRCELERLRRLRFPARPARSRRSRR